MVITPVCVPWPLGAPMASGSSVCSQRTPLCPSPSGRLPGCPLTRAPSATLQTLLTRYSQPHLQHQARHDLPHAQPLLLPPSFLALHDVRVAAALAQCCQRPHSLLPSTVVCMHPALSSGHNDGSSNPSSHGGQQTRNSNQRQPRSDMQAPRPKRHVTVHANPQMAHMQ